MPKQCARSHVRFHDAKSRCPALASCNVNFPFKKLNKWTNFPYWGVPLIAYPSFHMLPFQSTGLALATFHAKYGKTLLAHFLRKPDSPQLKTSRRAKLGHLRMTPAYNASHFPIGNPRAASSILLPPVHRLEPHIAKNVHFITCAQQSYRRSHSDPDNKEVRPRKRSDSRRNCVAPCC